MKQTLVLLFQTPQSICLKISVISVFHKNTALVLYPPVQVGIGRSGTQAASYRTYCVVKGLVDQRNCYDTTKSDSIQQWSEQVSKVAIRRVFIAAPQLDSASLLTSSTRDARFRRSDYKFFET